MKQNHYYPFGLKHESYNTQRLGYASYVDEDQIKRYILKEQPKFVGDGSYNYKYNGKEFQDELGLNMYDYGARNYDPALGRWMNINPLAEMYRRHTPYVYTVNNPVFFIDPDGMRVRNGMTAKRERLEENVAYGEKFFQDNHDGNLDKTKDDFSSKKEYKAYKKSVNRFKDLKKDLKKAIKGENQVNESIEDFKKNDPNNFFIADNLSVDIIVGSGSISQVKKESLSQYGGAVTETGFDVDSSGKTKVTAIYTTIDFSMHSTSSNVLAHEFGHAVNNVLNPTLANQNRVTHNCQDPANRNTFQSKMAMDWQQSYDTNKSNYPIPQLTYYSYRIMSAMLGVNFD